jgi:hypothetical protein
VPILLLRNFVTNLLELPTILDYSVRHTFQWILSYIYVHCCGNFCFLSFIVIISVYSKYLFFSEKFHTLALEGIPIFGLSNKAAAHRFVTLVDVSPFPYLKWFTSV